MFTDRQNKFCKIMDILYVPVTLIHLNRDKLNGIDMIYNTVNSLWKIYVWDEFDVEL